MPRSIIFDDHDVLICSAYGRKTRDMEVAGESEISESGQTKADEVHRSLCPEVGDFCSIFSI